MLNSVREKKNNNTQNVFSSLDAFIPKQMWIINLDIVIIHKFRLGNKWETTKYFILLI